MPPASSKPGRTNYTNYRFPHYLPDGSVVALKDAFDEIRTFYRISADGTEKIISPRRLHRNPNL